MNLETSKLLGGIGALLMFLGGITLYIGYYFGILEIVGIILVLLSLHSLANFYGNRGIFNNALFGVLAAVIGAIISVVVTVVAVLASLKDFLYQVFPGWDGNYASLQNLTPDTANFDPSTVTAFLIGILLVLVVVWVFAIISAFFVRRSLKELSVRSGSGLFATAGLLMLIGAVLTVILIGVILVWISALILAIAFFTMKEPEPVPPPVTTASPPPTYI
ncbi:MAG: DUF996 domain-containing protein [Candidatus Bathyarchaeota archaeon]|nr:DUF996 domain-containing protein [Candidatus Termiticorpusculum sp.]